MKNVISASRRTDLVAFFPEWLSGVIEEGKARIYGPARQVYTVDLQPEAVHTVVLWSKDFSSLIEDRAGLRKALTRYDQLYCLFTITGLGGSFIEREVPPPLSAFSQLPALVEIVGSPQRISLRFDPVIYWKEKGKLETNLCFFEKLAERASRLGIKDIRFSFTQWYGKALRRAAQKNFLYVDPSPEEKKAAALWLSKVAERRQLNLFVCSQRFLSEVPGIRPSSCIDGRLLQGLHPQRAPVSLAKDKSQRPECECTESLDIGSYSQSCPHSCLYCYANPRMR
ncbi:MAG: DUF1848 family protein [Candidatus Aminicenantales bacterium]